jgi:vitamin B12 transporter
MKRIVIISTVASLTCNLTATNLEKITITTASKTEQSIMDTTSNIDVITEDMIKQRRFTTLTEALNSLSGISFTRNGGLETATSVYLRGMDSKRVLVLIDGIRYNDITSLSGAPFEHLMINDIQQIEVLKGAGSSIWGADASAGVINIITKEAKNGLSGSLNAEYGSFKSKKYGGLLSYKQDNFYMKLNSEKVDSDSFSSQAPRGEDIDNFEDDAYENITTTIKAGYQFNKNNKLDISHTIIDSTGDYDGYNKPNDNTQYSTTKNQFTSINYQNTNGPTTLDLSAKRSDFDRDYPNGYTKEFDGQVDEFGFKVTNSYGKKDFVVMGADCKKFKHKNNINKEFKNQAIYLSNSNELEGVIAGKNIMTESLRYDIFDSFANKVTGKIGIKHFHENIDNFTTSLNFATAYNIPTLYNLYSNYGNPNIKPEETKSFDITAQYNGSKITYFNTRIKDMIDYDFATNKYNNLTGTSKIQGLELEYTKELIDDLFTSLNYTRLKTEDNRGDELNRRPKDSIKLAFDYYGLASTHLNINGEYIGDRKDGKNQTGNYTIVNMVANYDINDKTKIYIKVDNITDKYYQTIYGYAASPRAIYAGGEYSF